jgi:hypothetical protein
MGMNVHLQLPFPDRALSPNERPHYMKKASVVADYRRICEVEALVVRNRKTIALKAPVRAWVTFVCSGNLWDEDNATASLKAMWDGIVESGLIPGDSPDLLHVETTVIKGNKAAVLVRLEGS